MTCIVEGCTGPKHCRGLCRAHYTRLTKHGDVLAHIPLGALPTRPPSRKGQPCDVDGCDLTITWGDYCEAHYRRWKRNGDPGGAEIRHRTAVGECLTCVDVEWLLADNTDPDEIAKRLGYAAGREGLRRHLRGHGREDLAERINRVPWGVSA